MEWYVGLQLINRYTLTKRLGRGGFGEVWLATDRTTGTAVAIKRLLQLEKDHIERFGREARILWRLLDMPGVVNILDMHFFLPAPFLVMDYCAGGSMKSFVGQFNSWRMVAELLVTVAGTMAIVHGRNGFHRDLKPDNLLLPSPGAAWSSVRIADFGLAHVPITGSDSLTRHPGGTPGYMAPELLRGGVFTASADVHSLGMTAVALLTGGLFPEELSQLEIPSNGRDLLFEMIDVTPARRPSMASVAARVTDLLSPQPALQPRIPLSPPARPSNLFGDLLKAAAVAVAVGTVAKALGSAGAPSRRSRGYDPTVDRYRGADGRFQRTRR